MLWIYEDAGPNRSQEVRDTKRDVCDKNKGVKQLGQIMEVDCRLYSVQLHVEQWDLTLQYKS